MGPEVKAKIEPLIKAALKHTIGITPNTENELRL